MIVKCTSSLTMAPFIFPFPKNRQHNGLSLPKPEIGFVFSTVLLSGSQIRRFWVWFLMVDLPIYREKGLFEYSVSFFSKYSIFLEVDKTGASKLFCVCIK